MSQVQILPDLNFLSELYCSDAPDARLLTEYPSSNSNETSLKNHTKYIIHDPFPPPPRELLKVLGPHHLMCGWGQELSVTSEVAPSELLLQHWSDVFGSQGCPDWQPLNTDAISNTDGETEFITLFPHQSLSANQQVIDPAVNYELHSKEVIEKIDCPQAKILQTIEPPCIVKLSHGYAGLGNFFINSESDELAMQEELAAHWPDAVKVINSVIPNLTGDFGVQFYLRRDGSMVWLGFTEQHFNERKRWCGGTYSASMQTELQEELCAIVEPTGEYLHSRGYFGLVGIDILRDIANHFFLVDVNPRLTGITPFLMASRIFARDEGMQEGIYQASCRFSGSFEQLVESAAKIKNGRVVVLSGFEDRRTDATGPTTACHLSVTSESQDQNQRILESFLKA